MIFENQLINLIRKHLKVTNEIAHTDDLLDLITRVTYDGKVIFSHKLDLNPLYHIFRERLEQEAYEKESNEDLGRHISEDSIGNILIEHID